MTSILVQLEGVSKLYTQSAQTVAAVSDISLKFNKGEFSVLAGSSGSGKTTLLNLIGAIDTPSSGWVSVCNQKTNDMTEAQLAVLRLMHIGFIFQAYNLFPVLSVYENVQFLLQVRGVAAHLHKDIIMPVLQRLSIENLSHRRPSELSGGQQQRVAIARAIALKPDLILADEPTANLDSDTACNLLNLMAELNEQDKVTFIFSSHDPEVIRRARRVIRLKDGHVISDS